MSGTLASKGEKQFGLIESERHCSIVRLYKVAETLTERWRKAITSNTHIGLWDTALQHCTCGWVKSLT